jgi:acetoin utilization protein AcuC
VSARVDAVWTDDYVAYDFGPQHPLKPVRVQLTVELARACGLLGLPNVRMVEPRAATRAEIETVHAPEYVDAVARIGAGAPDPFGSYGWGIGIGDNPAFGDMHGASSLVCGGGIVAAESVWTGAAEHSWYPAGGLHHAMPDRASGFCIYNDPAVSIQWLLDHGCERVAYVDVDVHHGDGVQAIFYDDPRVLTISLHESGHFLFPGTGFVNETGTGDAEGTSVNVPLAPYTFDEPYRRAFERVVPPLVQAFKPQVLFTQLGCDTHVTDPLAHLALTTATYRYLAGALHTLAHDVCDGRWIATGGGGYQIYEVVPRAWTIYFAELSGGELPRDVPAEWIELARSKGAHALPAGFDDPAVEIPQARADEAAERARRSADEAAARVFGYHGLRA